MKTTRNKNYIPLNSQLVVEQAMCMQGSVLPMTQGAQLRSGDSDDARNFYITFLARSFVLRHMTVTSNEQGRRANDERRSCRSIVLDCPIGLTSCVGKLVERMINTRLVWHLEKNNIITPEQAGFRQHHSTEDQVTYIAQKIEDGFQDKQHTLTVWIDKEKAYDRAWKDGLRFKLQKSGVTGCMYQWISQYLTNRKARVYVNGTYSRKKTLLLLLQRSTDVQVKSSVQLMPQKQPSGRGLLPSPTDWSPDQHPAAMLADVSQHILGTTEGRGLGLVSLSTLTKGSV